MKRVRIFLCFLSALILCLAFFPSTHTVYADGTEVYVGGFPIGISINVGGLLVEDIIGVETEYGLAAVDGLRAGDIIKKINGTSVDSFDDISEKLIDGKVAEIELVRSGNTVTVEVKPIIEQFSQKPRLGIKIRDVIYGVGTVTFVRGDGTFSALGHEISDDLGTDIPFSGGKVHDCRIVGVKKGHKGEAGVLLSSLNTERVRGDVCCNNGFGISGKYNGKFEKTERYRLAERNEVHPGAAKIKTCVTGFSEYFDVEIIKASAQSERKEKGIVIRVTDKRLLDISGGVVRGMSGSPILQDGKIVGAITHVFLNDFTKGYGVYADFLN